MRRKLTDEERKRIGEQSRLNWQKPGYREKFKESNSGVNHRFYGGHHTEETKIKLRIARAKRIITEETRKKSSESHKKRWESIPYEVRVLSSPTRGKHHSEETKKKISQSHIGITHTEETRRKLCGRKGELSGMWKGGTSYLPYCNKFDESRKRACRDFFNNFCLSCGIHATENIIRWGNGYKQVKLHIHHIDHNKEQGCNGLPFNLVPLCTTCHGKENHHEEEFREYINKTLYCGFDWGIWNKEQYEKTVMYPETRVNN